MNKKESSLQNRYLNQALQQRSKPVQQILEKQTSVLGERNFSLQSNKYLQGVDSLNTYMSNN